MKYENFSLGSAEAQVCHFEIECVELALPQAKRVGATAQKPHESLVFELDSRYEGKQVDVAVVYYPTFTPAVSSSVTILCERSTAGKIMAREHHALLSNSYQKFSSIFVQKNDLLHIKNNKYYAHGTNCMNIAIVDIEFRIADSPTTAPAQALAISMSRDSI